MRRQSAWNVDLGTQGRATAENPHPLSWETGGGKRVTGSTGGIPANQVTSWGPEARHLLRL